MLHGICDLVRVDCALCVWRVRADGEGGGWNVDTGDRPYKCQHCGDQFARRSVGEHRKCGHAVLTFFSDLLSRHINKCHAHEKPVTSPGCRRKGSSSASRATTSKQACDQCVQTSLPCDGANPCGTSARSSVCVCLCRLTVNQPSVSSANAVAPTSNSIVRLPLSAPAISLVPFMPRLPGFPLRPRPTSSTSILRHPPPSRRSPTPPLPCTLTFLLRTTLGVPVPFPGLTPMCTLMPWVRPRNPPFSRPSPRSTDCSPESPPTIPMSRRCRSRSHVMRSSGSNTCVLRISLPNERGCSPCQWLHAAKAVSERPSTTKISALTKRPFSQEKLPLISAFQDEPLSLLLLLTLLPSIAISPPPSQASLAPAQISLFSLLSPPPPPPPSTCAKIHLAPPAPAPLQVLPLEPAQ